MQAQKKNAAPLSNVILFTINEDASDTSFNAIGKKLKIPEIRIPDVLNVISCTAKNAIQTQAVQV